MTILLTGLPSAGKSTLARAAALLIPRATEILDGDDVRRTYFPELGYDRASRDQNVQRTARIALMLARHGVTVLMPLIAPYRDTRDWVRRLHENERVGYAEAWVSTPLKVCSERDVKGLYRQALSGRLKNLTGISDVYEVPLSPDLTISTVDCSVDRCAGLIADFSMGRSDEKPAIRTSG